MSDTDVSNLLNLAIDKNPVDFAAEFNNIIQQRQGAALEARRIEIAQSLYANEEDSEEIETEGDDYDYAADDLDDVDLDAEIEDIDLEDLDIDLEDIEDIDLDDELDIDDVNEIDTE